MFAVHPASVDVKQHESSPCKTKLFRPRQEVKEDNSVRDADQLYGKNWRDSFVHHADHAVLGNWTGQLCSPCRPNCMAGSGENSSVRHTDHDVLSNWRGQLCSPCRPSCTATTGEDSSVRYADQPVRQQLERTALFAMQTNLYATTGEDSSVRHADQAVRNNWRGQLCSPCRPSCTPMPGSGENSSVRNVYRTVLVISQRQEEEK